LSDPGPAAVKTKGKKWVPYLIRGVLGTIIAITLVQYFLIPQKLSNWPIYMGIYFLANGVLSFKEARSAPAKTNRPILAALASIIGGVLAIISYVSYRVTPIYLGIYPYVFGAIVIVIGLLQAHHAVRMTPHPILKRAHRVFGFLEILLGIVMLWFQIDWQADAVAFVWVVLVAIYMFYVAHSIRNE
jgi:xanthine/uracil permease